MFSLMYYNLILLNVLLIHFTKYFETFPAVQTLWGHSSAKDGKYNGNHYLSQAWSQLRGRAAHKAHHSEMGIVID